MGALKIKSKEQALLVLDRLAELKEAEDFEFGDPNFPEQYEFINANGPLNAALCTRRAGKSYGVGEKLFKKAYDFPGSTVLYIALTRGSAESIMWKDVLLAIAKKKNIRVKKNNTKLEMTLPNGSIIKLAGADADEGEREKFLGGKYPYIAVDEAGSFATDLEQLIYEYLEPCVADYDGTIDLIGTPTMFWQGFFCKVTEGRESGWKIFKWNTSHNPHMPNWSARLAMLKERNSRIEETPGYKRMYLGQWVKDLDNLVYKYSAEINKVHVLPDAQIAGQVLGMDLGFNDATAYTLARYYENINSLYFIDSWKKSKQIIDDVVETMKEYIEDYDIHTIVIDNASKQVVETLKARFELYDVVIHAAEKTDKFEFIEIMNSDFITGRIKLLDSKTNDQEAEYGNLIKDPKSKKPKEHPGCDNHLCDAALYAWRHARNYLEKPLERELSLEDQLEQELEEAAMAQEHDEDDFENPFAYAE